MADHGQTLTRTLLGLTAGAGVLLAATGCGTGTQTSSPPLTQASATVQPSGVSTTPTTPTTASAPKTSVATSTVTSTVTSTPTSPSGPSSPSDSSPSSSVSGGAAECDVNALHLTATGGDAAMNHTYVTLVLTNISSGSCRTGGFGGVSMVGGGNGTQIGAPAVRQGDSYGRFTLRAGQKMTSQLSIANAGVYDSGHCAPTSVDGLRVYPPNSTKALFVTQKLTGCKNTAVKLMQQQAFRQS